MERLCGLGTAFHHTRKENVSFNVKTRLPFSLSGREVGCIFTAENRQLRYMRVAGSIRLHRRRRAENLADHFRVCSAEKGHLYDYEDGRKVIRLLVLPPTLQHSLEELRRRSVAPHN